MKQKQETIKQNQLIYIDACELMNTDSFIKFVEANKDHLQLNNQKLIILGSIHCEMNKLQNDEYGDRRMKARKVLDYIYKNKNLFDIRKHKEYRSFGDRDIQLEIFENHGYKPQVLITEDHKLARDTYRINFNESCEGREVNVFSLDHEGHLYFPKYLENMTEVHFNSEEIIEVVEPETNKNSVNKTITTFIGGILSGLVAAPFLFKKLKAYF